MSNYRRRLERDLDGWIGQGLVPADNRAAILGSVEQARRLDAATVLAVIAALLAGVAVIAFVAANWAAIPRLFRFVMILGAFLGSAGGAAFLHASGRAMASHAVLSLAALIFAGAIGLTGQIFDIAGDPQAALRGAGLGAMLLALAGRSPWTAAVGLVLLALGDITDGGSDRAFAGWLVIVAPLSAVVALLWRSQALAHAAGVATILAVPTFDRGLRLEPELVFGLAALVLALAAAGARILRERYEAPAGVLYGWFVWGALLWFGAAGFAEDLRGALHSILWMTLSVAVVVLGRHDRLALVTAAGIVSLLASGAVLLFNLGVGLLTAAMVFGGLALAALAVALLLKRRGA